MSLLSEPEEVGKIFLELSPDYTMLQPRDEPSLSLFYFTISPILLFSEMRRVYDLSTVEDFQLLKYKYIAVYSTESQRTF